MSDAVCSTRDACIVRVELRGEVVLLVAREDGFSVDALLGWVALGEDVVFGVLVAVTTRVNGSIVGF